VFARAVSKRISSIRLNEKVAFPTLSFPVSREKVQGLGSGGFVSTGKWWGSGERLWSLMKSWYTLSAIYLFVLVRSWAEVVTFMSPKMRGVRTLFVFIYACISKREACASGELSDIWAISASGS